MKLEAEKQEFYYNLGEAYFWLSGHYDAALNVLKPELSRLKKTGCAIQILDAGCGPGNFVSRLKSFGSVCGTDYSNEALLYCLRKHAIPAFRSSLETISIKNESFDAVVSLEVLEHIENDQTVLREYYRLLKPGGVGLISVPAFQMLWGPHDEWFGHVRRYSRHELSEKIKASGFEIVRCDYFKCIFFLPMLILRNLKRMFKLYDEVKTDYISIPNWMNQMLRLWIVNEVKWRINQFLPFGTHLLCLFKKPGDPLHAGI